MRSTGKTEQGCLNIDNHAAERAVWPAVVMRKITGGSRSAIGR